MAPAPAKLVHHQCTWTAALLSMAKRDDATIDKFDHVETHAILLEISITFVAYLHVETVACFVP